MVFVLSLVPIRAQSGVHVILTGVSVFIAISIFLAVSPIHLDRFNILELMKLLGSEVTTW